MSTFVLVHGAWQGTSTWDLIVPELQRVGHKVFTPVLTGLGADSHRLSPAVNLDTHIDNVTHNIAPLWSFSEAKEAERPGWRRG